MVTPINRAGRDFKQERVLIMGAAGQYFHLVNVCLRDDPDYQAIAFPADPTWPIASQLLSRLRCIGCHVRK